MPLAIGVVDDQEIFRQGLVAVLEDDPEIVVKVNLPTGPIEDVGLDVVVVSWRSLPTVDPSCPVVLLASDRRRTPGSSNPRTQTAAVLPRRGLTATKLILAVRSAAAGLRVDATEEEPPAALDERRLGVLRLLASGADTRTIARRLRYSERTVKTDIREIEVALGASSRAQAVAEAVRLGLI